MQTKEISLLLVEKSIFNLRSINIGFSTNNRDASVSNMRTWRIVSILTGTSIDMGFIHSMLSNVVHVFEIASSDIYANSPDVIRNFVAQHE